MKRDCFYRSAIFGFPGLKILEIRNFKASP